MTDEERSSADNLIFLCGTHHDAIDSQLHLHTKEFLLRAKAEHESQLSRAVKHALGKIGYADLELVCNAIGNMDADLSPIEVPLAVNDKIELNGLSIKTQEKVGDGLAQAGKVAAFVEFQSRFSRNFGQRLAARFKSAYYAAQAGGLEPDEIFEYILLEAYENSGPEDSPTSRAAALAVVAFLFERCEIFKHEPVAS
ncbi:ABC-three component system protein [Pseudarthrobacter siccitolerans]